MLIFGSQKGIDFLSTSEHWFMDGTFITLPPQFMQLYTIHGIKNGRNVIGLYSMLMNKRQDTYEELLSHVSNFTTSINIDFERAAVNACRVVFPLALEVLLLSSL